ncbi:MAG: RDD family protein [Nocardioidaceae bacterium]
MSTPSSADSATYVGKRLGLPRQGRGSVAGWGRRALALLLDWFASMLVAATFAGPGVFSSRGLEAWAPMAVFLVEASVLTPLLGGSFGQLLTRVAVVRVDGKPLNLLLAVARTFLICLVIPPLIFNRDQRGLHDLVAGTVTVRR